VKVALLLTVAAISFAGCRDSGGGHDHSVTTNAAGVATLDQASTGTAAVRELLSAARNLSEGRDPSTVAKVSAKIASEAERKLIADRPVQDPGASVLRAQVRAGRALASLARRLANPDAASTQTHANLSALNRARRGLSGLTAQASTATDKLTDLAEAVTELVRDARADLISAEQAGQGRREQIRTLQNSLRAGENGPMRLARQLSRHVADLKLRLAERIQALSGPSATTGPAGCGLTPAGSQVVINAGTIVCEEALSVAENSSGPNSATAPPGWDCSKFATNLGGGQLAATDGYGCLYEASGVEISIYIPGSASQAQDPSSRCPAGEDFVVPYGQPDSAGHCVVAEGAENED
jgi:hypothetical protein